MSVTLEFYGVARLRTGRETLTVEAATVGEALAAMERACPAAAGTLVAAGRLVRHYRLSLNGKEFVSNPETALADGDTMIVLSAEAGG
jgi:molybdopterin converting factor small subunit